MKPIFLRELKDRRYTLLAYCLVVIVLLIVYVSIFPSIKASAEQFQQLYNSYPAELFKAMGIENLSIGTLENFLAIEQYSIVWPIMALLLASSLAGNTIAGQIEKGTIGYYLAMPIGRLRLFISKYLSGLAEMGIFVVISVMGVLPLGIIINTPVSGYRFATLSLLSFLFMVAMYSVAMLLSSLFSERSKVYMIMGGLLILMYVANVVAGLKDGLSWLSNYSVFHYYDAQHILSGGTLSMSSVLVFSALTLVFTLLAATAFIRRDISV